MEVYMKKKIVPGKKTRKRKPGPKSTDGMPVRKKAYKRRNVLKGLKMDSDEYKLLDKGGLEKLFKTPQSLWEAACDYFKWVKLNPWYKKEWKSDFGLVDVPVGRPMTIKGMCIHMGANSEYYRNFKNTLSPEDRVVFSSVINKIDEIIYTQKFEGAALGAFNANIISRDLGLADNQNVNLSDNRKEVGDLFPLDGTLDEEKE
jgi:hypothetical protein